MGSALTSLLAAGMVAAPSAEAAWTTGVANDGGKVRVCKVPLGGGDLKVKVRLDNRRAKHGHVGYVYRLRGGKWTDARVRAGGGEWSGTKSLRVNRGDAVGAGIDEIDGPGLGGTMAKSSIPRC
ncbi:hypothetical protein [Nocardioides pantholopis]|uniref:hypothetical protein n=1 Tax=Nocardioides pantholopis TaxID=2483798 RepID=UPI000F075205|nr:hypothetical protein [Nocardioides pantholopis]